MLSPEDLKQIAEKGITEEQVATQLEEFKKGFPFLKLEAAAGIAVASLLLPTVSVPTISQSGKL